MWYIWSVIPVSALQVGKDQKAQAFLATLDNDPTVGKNVDCTSYYVSFLQQWLLKKHAAVYAVPTLLCPGGATHASWTRAQSHEWCMAAPA